MAGDYDSGSPFGAVKFNYQANDSGGVDEVLTTKDGKVAAKRSLGDQDPSSVTFNASPSVMGYQYKGRTLTPDEFNALKAAGYSIDSTGDTGAANANPTPTNPNPSANAILDSVDPNKPAAAPPVTSRAPRVMPGFTNELPGGAGASATLDQLSNYQSTRPGATKNVAVDAATKANVATAAAAPAATPAATTPAPTGAGAPTFGDTDAGAKVNSMLNGLNSYGQDIYNLAQDNTGESAAEAQLKQADQLAKIRAADQLRNSQAGALATARSSRNRGDRALLERQAVGEQSYLGQEAQRQDVVQNAETAGQLASLRATETEHDRQFKLDALKTAGDLGLNTAALEVDIGKADLGSVTNTLNQQFDLLKQQGQLGLGYAQLDEAHAKNALDFTQGMAAIQEEYDRLSVDDQNAADALMMQKYGIDQQTMVALKKIKQDGKFQWDKLLSALIGGGATGATSALAASALKG